MKKLIKKGFTLVELLIVIAVLAILSTVTVVIYFNFVGEAELSADEQAVTQMNIALQAQEVIDAPDNVEEAKDVLEAAGLTVEDYKPLAKENIFYYDESEVRVLIYNQEEQVVTFPEDLAKKYETFTEGNKSGTWYLLNDQTYEWVDPNNYEGTNYGLKLQDALRNVSDNQIIVLSEDATLLPEQPLGSNSWYFPTNDNGNARLDLNGHTLTIGVGVGIGGFKDEVYGEEISKPVSNVYISNGKITGSTSNSVLLVNEDSTLTLDNVEYLDAYDVDSNKNNNSLVVYDNANLTIINSTVNNTSKYGTAVLLFGNKSETNIFNSNLTANAFGITTNAGADLSWDVRANVEDSTVTCTEGAAVLVNVPGTYNFIGSNLNGNGWGVVIRGGDSYFENCAVTINGDSTNLLEDVFNDTTSDNRSWELSDTSLQKADSPFIKGNWLSGNYVQLGALIVGDWAANSYNYNASCKLVNTSVSMDDTYTALPIVYLSQDDGFTTSFDYDDKCTFSKKEQSFTGEEAVIVNTQIDSDSESTFDNGNVFINGVKA